MSMVRETSIEIYNQIRSNGLLSKKRWKVYTILFDNGPLTGGELAKIYSKKFGDESRFSESVRNRLTELKEVGTVKHLTSRACAVTGNKSIVWEVTKNLPVKITKTSLQILEERLEVYTEKIKLINERIELLVHQQETKGPSL